MHLQCPSAALRRHEDRAPDRQQALPAEWRAEAIAPLRFTTHRDYEMPASRTLGYDKDGRACYYQHAFALGEPRSDDKHAAMSPFACFCAPYSAAPRDVAVKLTPA